MKEEQIEPVVVEPILNIVEDIFININYTYHADQYEGVLMSYEAALDYVRISEKELVFIRFIAGPATHAHMDHIQKIKSIWNGKPIRMGWRIDTSEPAVVERLIRMVVDCRQNIENDLIEFSYDKNSRDDGERLEIYNRWSRFIVYLFSEGNPPDRLYNHLLDNIKLLRNSNLLMNIRMESKEPRFAKLFVDLGWTFDDSMVAWNNGTRADRNTFKTFAGDNNDYWLIISIEEEILEMDHREEVSDSDYSSS